MPPFTLIVAAPQAPLSPQRYTFETTPIVLGRERSCDIVLFDPQATISRRHAEIHTNGTSYTLTDLGSKNATYLNGKRLRAKKAYSLRTGDYFRLGPYEIGFEEVTPLTLAAPHTLSLISDDASTLLHDAYGEVLHAPPAAPNTLDVATLRQANQELILLSEIAFAIGAARDLHALATTLVQRAAQAVQAEQGALNLLEPPPADGQATNSRTIARAVTEPATPLHLDDAFIAWMQAHRRPLRLDAASAATAMPELTWPAAVRSLLCVPLIVHDRLIGLLTVFNKQAADAFSEGDERLLALLGAQSAQVIETVRHHETMHQRMQAEEDLRVAHRIQTHWLPAGPPQVPGFEIAGASRPAPEVGGDLFDFVHLPAGRLGVCLGDVSGKGLSSALVMAHLQATLRSLMRVCDEPKRIVQHASALLYAGTDRRTFATLCYLELVPEQGLVRYVNAGHPRPLLRRADGSIRHLPPSGTGLGLLPDSTFRQKTEALSPGDVLVLYSDGLTETRSEDGTEFGDDRMNDVMERYAQAPAATLADRLLDAAEQHRGTAPQRDDVTVVVLRCV